MRTYCLIQTCLQNKKGMVGAKDSQQDAIPVIKPTLTGVDTTMFCIQITG